MKKVLLVNPNQMKPAVAPIALDYLAGALQGKGFQIDILDLCFSTDVAQSIATYFAQNQVMAIGITVRNTDDTMPASGEFFLPRVKQVTDFLLCRNPFWIFVMLIWGFGGRGNIHFHY